ncbi:MAG TPA: nuclear pore complex subunit [Crocinitomicaceae bacterium]|nr:DUF1987 domain-containing protein [Flavobacteriales bacterium]HBW87247.1 nuclear pore complex subunit [Crocinitomicaceae bacterium]
MEYTEIIATNTTPLILLNHQGTIEIIGKCIPENSAEFWGRVQEWFFGYMKNPASHTTIIIQIDYLNTSSSKELLHLLYNLNEMVQQGKTAEVKWYYYAEDADMKEVGKDYAHMLKVPFEISEIKLEHII